MHWNKNETQTKSEIILTLIQFSVFHYYIKTAIKQQIISILNFTFSFILITSQFNIISGIHSDVAYSDISDIHCDIHVNIINIRIFLLKNCLIFID